MSTTVILFAIIVFLLGSQAFYVWRTSAIISELTNKLMSRDYREFASVSTIMDKKKPAQKLVDPMTERKRVRDPQLGTHF